MLNGKIENQPASQVKKQPVQGVKKQENIVIEFTALPEKYRTSDFRKKFDKDGSGFLESKNSAGYNEVKFMQDALGVDLSKYKSNITKVTISHEQTGDIDYHHAEWTERYSTGYDANGNKLVKLALGEENVKTRDENYDKHNYDKDVTQNNFERTEYKTENGVKVAEIQKYDANSNKVGESTVVKTYKNVNFDGKVWAEAIETKNPDGTSSSVYKRGGAETKPLKIHIEDSLYEDCYPKGAEIMEIEKDAQGRVLSKKINRAEEKHNFEYESPCAMGAELEAKKSYKYSMKRAFYEEREYKDEEMFDGNSKNKLQKSTTIINPGKTGRNEDGEEIDLSEKNEVYTLNGKQVDVKKIDNRRFEINDGNGVEIYSHDGNKLRADYLTGNSVRRSDGYQKITSLNGKSNWYKDNKGNMISERDYYSARPFEVKQENGKTTYTYYGKPVNAVKEGPRYKATLNGKVCYFSQDGKMLKDSYVEKQKAKEAYEKLSWYEKIAYDMKNLF